MGVRGFVLCLFLCIFLCLFPPAALYGEEIVGREAEDFSGTLQNGVPAEHRILLSTEGTMSLTLSFVGGNSDILLEVFDRNKKCVYRTKAIMAGQFLIRHLPVGNYLLRLTPIQKVQKDLPYQLQVLLPKTTYLNIEAEEVPLAAENSEGFAPIPFSAYAMILLMLLWGALAIYLYRFLRNWERRWEWER
jgi:hypothetical protein